VTDPATPAVVARVPIADARNVYVARTYAYVAGGKEGVVIVDVETPDKPFVDQVFDGGGKLEGVNDVKVASTAASLFAYVGDDSGLYVVQLTSPATVPGFQGFSPRPAPVLIARRHTHEPVLAVSKGVDRDRAADESGNQVAIFNRQGSRPMNLVEMQRMYLRNGSPWTVTDEPRTQPAGVEVTDAGGVETTVAVSKGKR
jgi:hypothetical protein